MSKKCAVCSSVLDVLCPVPGCPGHYHESVGDRCAYCAHNQREAVLLLRNLAPSLVSSLEGLESDVEGEVYPSCGCMKSTVVPSPFVILSVVSLALARVGGSISGRFLRSAAA